MTTFGSIIKKNRVDNNLNEKELAEILGVDESLIINWESDKINPNDKNLDDLSAVFDIDLKNNEAKELKIIPNKNFEKIIEIENKYGYKKDGTPKQKPGRKMGIKNKISFGAKSPKNIEKIKEIAKLTTLGYNIQHIAEKYNISRQRVSQILRKAIDNGMTVVIRKNAKTEKLYKDIKNVILVTKTNVESLLTRKCKCCQKEFTVKKNVSKRKTCSEECFVKSRRSGGEWSRHEFVELKCKGCGKEFKRSKYIQSIGNKKRTTNNFYCSRDCYTENNKVYFDCIVCDKNFHRRKKTLTCSPECYKIYKKIRSKLKVVS